MHMKKLRERYLLIAFSNFEWKILEMFSFNLITNIGKKIFVVLRKNNYYHIILIHCHGNIKMEVKK